MDELGQVTSHSGLKTERNFKAQVIIQHHGAVQPSPDWLGLCQGHRLLVWLATVLEKKQLEKANPFTLAVCGHDI